MVHERIHYTVFGNTRGYLWEGTNTYGKFVANTHTQTKHTDPAHNDPSILGQVILYNTCTYPGDM